MDIVDGDELVAEAGPSAGYPSLCFASVAYIEVLRPRSFGMVRKEGGVDRFERCQLQRLA